MQGKQKVHKKRHVSKTLFRWPFRAVKVHQGLKKFAIFLGQLESFWCCQSNKSQYNILTFCPLCNHFMVSSKGGFSCGCNILRMRHWSLSWLPAWTPRSWLPKMAAVESVRWEWLWPNPIEPGFWLRLQFSNFGPRWNETRSFRNGSQQT